MYRCGVQVSSYRLQVSRTRSGIVALVADAAQKWLGVGSDPEGFVSRFQFRMSGIGTMGSCYKPEAVFRTPRNSKRAAHWFLEDLSKATLGDNIASCLWSLCDDVQLCRMQWLPMPSLLLNYSHIIRDSVQLEAL